MHIAWPVLQLKYHICQSKCARGSTGDREAVLCAKHPSIYLAVNALNEAALGKHTSNKNKEPRLSGVHYDHHPPSFYPPHAQDAPSPLPSIFFSCLTLPDRGRPFARIPPPHHMHQSYHATRTITSYAPTAKSFPSFAASAKLSSRSLSADAVPYTFCSRDPFTSGCSIPATAPMHATATATSRTACPGTRNLSHGLERPIARSRLKLWRSLENTQYRAAYVVWYFVTPQPDTTYSFPNPVLVRI